ncbi:hypothetical protein BSF38_04794 [Paludisphaera borealis]|uniref:Uncharacterized protein n=2 Tax=Paludisphaera borealis TaxID=1387353 RepID=A0A1U7CWA1_9BACT|nr:hypothetical protein BSF38_04794 [Paludisphaera borealis]
MGDFRMKWMRPHGAVYRTTAADASDLIAKIVTGPDILISAGEGRSMRSSPPILACGLIHLVLAYSLHG